MIAHNQDNQGKDMEGDAWCVEEECRDVCKYSLIELLIVSVPCKKGQRVRYYTCYCFCIY